MVWRSQALKSCLIMAAVCGMMTQVSSLGYAQYSSSPGSEMRAIGEPEGKIAAESGTTIIPSVRLTERYDSNVFFLQGNNLEDFVTSIAPQLRVSHRNQWIEGVVSGGGTGEVYVKNPGLNYVGANGSVALNLDGAMNALVRGLGLRISDSITYTPQPPAFAAPTGGSQLSEVFVQGLQARRANSFTNTAKVEVSYALSTYLSVISTYTDRRIRFGKGTSTPTGVVATGEFINTNFQTLTSGFVGQLSTSDEVSLLHQYQKATFSNLGLGDLGFSTQGAMVRWSRSITPELQVTGEGGFSLLSQNSGIYPVSSASLVWQGQYTTVRVSFSRAVTPSFLFSGTPLLSQSVTATVIRQIAAPLSISLSGSYATNRSVPDSSLLRFESYSVSPGLEYKFTPNLTATFSYTHNEFQRDFSGKSSDFGRNMALLSIVAEWR